MKTRLTAPALIFAVLAQTASSQAFADQPQQTAPGPATSLAVEGLVKLAFAGVTGADAEEDVSMEATARVIDLQPLLPRKNFIGTHFFSNYAQASGIPYDDQTKDVGLLPDFNVLNSASFKSSTVSPEVKEVYEHTSRFKLVVYASSDPLTHRVLSVSNWAAAQMGNSLLPLDPFERQMNSTVAEIGPFPAIRSKARVWARSYADNGKAALVGMYNSVQFHDETYVSVIFPYVDSNQISVLKPTNLEEGGLRLSSKEEAGSFAGDYYCPVDDQGHVMKVEIFHKAYQQLDVHFDKSLNMVTAEHHFIAVGKDSELVLHYKFVRKE